MKSIALLLFDGVELMDFAGPLEVFSVANKRSESPLFEITTVSPAGVLVKTANGLTVEADRACAEIEVADWLVVPGGIGTRQLLDEADLLGWIRRVADSAEVVLSVCSGSLLLGKAGLLEGLEATTHRAVFDELTAAAPGAKIVRDVRFTDNGKVITSAGISAGIDASFHLLEREFGEATASDAADYMEYRRSS